MPKPRMMKAEKVAAIMDVFQGNHKDGSMMFNEKDLKRICSKEKGVTEQSVMEVLKEEMDGMYDSDMLGSSKIYWSLKSTQVHKRKARAQGLAEETEKLDLEVQALKKRKADVDAQAVSGMNERERSDAEKKKVGLLKQKDHLAESLKNCVDVDYYRSLQETSTIAFDAANRWTDNIFCGTSHMINKFGCEKGDVHGLLREVGLKNAAELDYLPE